MINATSRPLKFLIFTFGSAGDVHPFTGIGRALKARGHEVHLATSGYFKDMVERAGLGFSEIGTPEDFLKATLNPDLWHPTKGVQFVARECMAPSLEPTYRIIQERYEPGRTVVVASSLAIGAKCAYEKLGVPYATVHLSPALFRSWVNPPVVPAMPLHKFPVWGQKLGYWFADKVIVDPAVAPVYNAFRKTIGLEPVSRIFRDPMHSPLLTMGVFPDWFCPVASDWPKNACVTGFPLFDGKDAEPDAQDVTRYLNEGEPPVVFTAGSAMRQGEGFFAAAVGAARKLKHRCMMLTRFPEQLPKDLPANVKHFSYVPFGQVLPRAVAFVHHGGVGSTAQGFAAGVPQMVVHFSHDQPDNAERIRKLGAGEGLSVTKFNENSCASMLEKLLSDPGYRQRALALKARCEPEKWMRETCQRLENVIQR